MKRVLVIGAGFMGSGIAQVSAQSGYQVYLTDINLEARDQAFGQIRGSLEKLYTKGLVADSPQVILDRIIPESGLAKAAQADWVIECVLEIEDLKKEIFKELDRLAPPVTPLASNTSSIPISRLAQATQHPDRVLGLHFFGPVPLMQLVEVVKGEKTSQEIFNRGLDFVKSLAKKPVGVRQDIPGFVMNRIFSAAFKEAVELVSKGVVSPEEVDLGMRLGYGWAAGPFEVADNAGLDTFALINRTMKALGEEQFIPRSDLIESLIKEGRLGRKVGRGFYRYGPDGKRLTGKD